MQQRHCYLVSVHFHSCYMEMSWLHGHNTTKMIPWQIIIVKQTNRQTDDAPPTSGPGCFVIRLADQLLVIHQIKFITGRKLSWADEAGKALKVVHIFLGPSNNLSGRDRLCTTCTASPKLPVRIKKRDQKEKPQNCATTKYKLWKFNEYLNTKAFGMEARQITVGVSLTWSTRSCSIYY